ncbi:Protein IDA-LIKE 4 [Cardamine amara subsp. amara]|uniref:Protein IDA-LIKE 4 n=1 Tax=Cardamine amara subsp. amara TaxID=228776 RepID=A0ABD1BWJ4_CARAN
MFPTHSHYWRKRLSMKPQALLLLLVLILCFFFIHHCDASRFSSSTVFYRNPDNDHNKNSMRRGHFLGFLPRRFPVPASAPSRKHNDIGIQALLSP